jgi:hypothetical protein
VSDDASVRRVDAWGDTFRISACTDRRCRKNIGWIRLVESGKWHPFDLPLATLERRREGQNRREVLTLDLGRTHFATCPGAKAFSKKARR